MAAIEFTPPAEIDRDTPQEVRVAALEQLSRVALELEKLVAETVKQVRNAGQQDALEAGGRENPQGVYELRRPREAALLEPLNGAAWRLKTLAFHVRSTADEYDADPDAGVLS